MKKIIAVLIALAMVLSMSVMAFASYNGVLSPIEVADGSEENYRNACSLEDWQLEDYANWWKYIDTANAIKEQGIYTNDDGSIMVWEDAWKAYTRYVASNLTSDTAGAASELVSISQGGYMKTGDIIAIVGESIMGGAGGDGESGDLSGIISGIIDKITGGGNAEGEVTADAYASELAALINSGASFDEITTKIGDDLASGKIVLNQIPDIISILSSKIEAGEIENNETVQKVMEFLKGLGDGSGEGGFEFPDFGEITLPGDNGNSESGSFLDTILGIIGSIGDIFNPTDPEPDDPSNGGNNNNSIPNTGDVAFIAVGAVAAVAGVAFVLTRKKSDAE